MSIFEQNSSIKMEIHNRLQKDLRLQMIRLGKYIRSTSEMLIQEVHIWFSSTGSHLRS